jgi:hypothetical protein
MGGLLKVVVGVVNIYDVVVGVVFSCLLWRGVCFFGVCGDEGCWVFF